MRAIIVVVIAATLGSCSTAMTHRHPRRERSGALSCSSYVAPVVDSVFATGGLGLVGMSAWLAYDDPELRELMWFSLLTAAVTAPFVYSAVVGFQNNARCRAELQTIRSPSAPPSAPPR